MMCIATKAFIGIAATLALGAVPTARAQTAPDPLAQGFRTPPDSARPRTWWHWTNGNVTEDGITKDLEWMKRVGIGGFQLADVSAGGGQMVEKKISFGTPEWYHAVHHAADEAQRLNLEMSIFSSPGWSEAGGPWVKPEQAMKKFVWSETRVDSPVGGLRKFEAKLPDPPSNQGPVRDLSAGARPDAPKFYRDSAVIAYKTPPDAVTMADLHLKATSNDGPVDDAALVDDSLNTSVTINAPKDGSPAWLQYEFDKPFTARALSLGCRSRIPVGRILSSDDGIHFETISTLPGPQGYHGAAIRTFAFPAVAAKFFRIELDGAGLLPAAVIHGGTAIPAPQYILTEAIFYSDARVNRWEDKGAFGSLMDRYDMVPTPGAPDSAVIDQKTVVDLTAKLQPDGTLDWDVPEGNWTILRMGYSLTGAMNRPSTPAGSGLEVDKLSAKYVREYFNGYMGPIEKELGDRVGSTLQYMTMDSWEAGMQNWTDDMIAEFRARRGYDPTPWLPVLAGRVVVSGPASDRFLWDFRRTLADMFAGEYYGTMDDELHKIGMKAYAEASGVALEIPEDTLLNKSHIDIPMAEFWVHALHPESMYYVDVRGAASAAHVYGKPIVATETFTGGGYEAPYTLKKIADYWFTQGVNRLVFHTSAEQPLDTKPGNTMVGTHINRNITWAEQAGPVMTYFARVSYMLQQGSPVADLAYLLPEGAPSTMPFWGAGLQPAPPPGYDYDYLNTDILLHHMSVTADGRIHVDGSEAMPQGMTYRVLVLPPTQQMTQGVLAKLHELVEAGATMVGPRPADSPGLEPISLDYRGLVADLWGDMDGVTDTQHAFGKGMTYWGLTLDEVLHRLQVPADFVSTHGIGTAPAWVHRQTKDADIYFVVNQADAPQHIDARFRTDRKAVSIWRPMTGEMDAIDASTGTAEVPDRGGNRQPGIEPAAYVAQPGLTAVSLDLAERESVFVVFRNAANTSAPSVPAAPHMSETTLTTIAGPWTLSFPPNWGAPASVQLPQLTSWTESTDPSVKYFSGTATYSKQIAAPRAWFQSGRRVYIDLGTVRDIAEVEVNGKPAGMVWAPPYRVDVTSELKPGANQLTIKVTNEWTNRIVGDRLAPPEKRVLPQSGAAPLRGGAFFGPREPSESGLIGTVRLLAVSPQ
jgi:alpha-L-rhamnosidase